MKIKQLCLFFIIKVHLKYSKTISFFFLLTHLHLSFTDTDSEGETHKHRQSLTENAQAEIWQWRFRTNSLLEKNATDDHISGFLLRYSGSTVVHDGMCVYNHTQIHTHTQTHTGLLGLQAPKPLAFIKRSCLMRKGAGLHSRARQKPGEWVSGLTQRPRQSLRNG